MKMYQPMMFVGIGGTGCEVGIELERRLREEFCGPDGRRLAALPQFSRLRPFELPSCVQLVYGDLAQGDMRKARTSSPGDVSRANASFIDNLVPNFVSSTDVSLALRKEAPDWLPPIDNEPRIAPLIDGAGQIPTVARAALFETIRESAAAGGGLEIVTKALRDAIGRLATSGGEILALTGATPQDRAVDVFVSFSVAGGTGSGLFLDFLHLIGDTFERALQGSPVRVYPLVLMPSAFGKEEGGGRFAELNGGPALIDLFRLVDQLNTGDPSVITYPGGSAVQLKPTTVQTAFLFTRPTGMTRGDLHRSMVSLILSLIGSQKSDDREEAAQAPAGDAVSFADRFINRAAQRSTSSLTGIGNQGVSTALVASLSIPQEEIAEILGDRLLSRAAVELQKPTEGEVNKDVLRRFLASAGLGPLRTRDSLEVSPPDETQKGAGNISAALSARYADMQVQLRNLRRKLDEQTIPQMATFDYLLGLQGIMQDLDLFRAARVVEGDSRLQGDLVDRQGVIGFLQRRADPPSPPDAEFKTQPPALSQIKDKLGGLKGKRWSDAPVPALRARQDAWYAWRTQAEWHSSWANRAATWQDTIARLRREIDTAVAVFSNHASQDTDRFSSRCQQLYEPRVGVVYFLPPGGTSNDLSGVYQQVIARLRQRLGLAGTATEGQIVNGVLGPLGWWDALQMGNAGGPEHALAAVQQQLKRTIQEVLGSDAPGEEPLLPALRLLLPTIAGASGDSASTERFKSALAELLPNGFYPQGSATSALRILVSYPSVARDAHLEQRLEALLRLPQEPGSTIEWQAGPAEAITVALTRTSMGINEVDELRSLVQKWPKAQEKPQRDDYLWWRQRRGYKFSWLLTTERDRVRIMQRFLCALWDGLIDIPTGEGSTLDNPTAITVKQLADEAQAIELSLAQFGSSSSWGSLIRSYEEYTLDATPIQLDACAALMNYRLDGLNRGACRPVSDGYLAFVKTAEEQERILREQIQSLPETTRARAELLLRFWTVTVPAARDLPFDGDAFYGNLRALEIERKLPPAPTQEVAQDL
jgi:hypothetical protein